MLSSLIAAVVSFGITVPVSIDIHLPVTAAGAKTATTANQFLRNHLQGEDIDFASTASPHITLYLTLWECVAPSKSSSECVEYVKAAVDATAQVLGSDAPLCEVEVTNAYAAGKEYRILHTCLTLPKHLVLRVNNLNSNLHFPSSYPLSPKMDPIFLRLVRDVKRNAGQLHSTVFRHDCQRFLQIRCTKPDRPVVGEYPPRA